MQEQDYIVKEDMICPVTKAHCDDECCPVGSTCNMSSEEIVDSGITFFSEEFKEKMEARRKQLNLKWEGWEEDERERQGGGMLIVIAFIAGIGVVVGAVIYTLIGLH
jgi:hypothetical protein